MNNLSNKYSKYVLFGKIRNTSGSMHLGFKSLWKCLLYLRWKLKVMRDQLVSMKVKVLDAYFVYKPTTENKLLGLCFLLSSLSLQMLSFTLLN